MTSHVEVRLADRKDKEKVVQLLQTDKLPTEDLSTTLENFYVAMDENEIIGAIGLERYDGCGLLRSLVVNPVYRNQRIAGELILQLETRASALGIECMYLLTETAPMYFEKKGYRQISRNDVPENLKQSSEFSHVCPSSTIVMKKQLS